MFRLVLWAIKPKNSGTEEAIQCMSLSGFSKILKFNEISLNFSIQCNNRILNLVILDNLK
jgi:hypothetical protein